MKLILLILIFLSFMLSQKAYSKEEIIGHIDKNKTNILNLEDIFLSIEKSFPVFEITKIEKTISQNRLLSLQGNFDTYLTAKNSFIPLGYYTNNYFDFYIKQNTTLWGTTFFGGWRNGIGKFPSYEGKKETLSFGEFRFGLEIPILKNGFIDKNRTNLIKAQIEININDLKIIQKRNELFRKASEKYFKWVSAGNKYLIAEDLLNLSQKRMQYLEESYKLGITDKINVLENKRAIYQRQQKLLIAQRDYKQASFELSMFFRDEIGQIIDLEKYNFPTKYKIEEDLKKFNPLKDFENSLYKNPELKIVEEKISKQKVELLLSENQINPSLDFQIALSQDIGPGSETKQPFEIDIGVYFSYPFQQREYTGKIQEIKNQIKQIELEKNFIKETYLNDIKISFNNLKTNLENYNISKLEYNLARELQELESERFKLGNSDIIILNIREQNTADAVERKINAITDLLKSIIDYNAILYNL